MGTPYSSVPGGQPAGAGGQRLLDNLALAFQEVFTAVARLRAGRQVVTDAEQFRHQMRHGVKVAEEEAARRGYPAEAVRMALFAVVAFLDESVLNLQHPAFANWPRMPMQEEYFGRHVAGEVFFQNLQRLLGAPDAHNVTDLLEVYQLCLLLGYRGRYGLGGHGELRSLMGAVAEKIRRVRGAEAWLSPQWAFPAETARPLGADPWVKRLLLGAVACFTLALALFVGYKLSLGAGASDIRVIATQGQG
ncbi:MAG: DotU family type IV/VI secretion system protein [Acidobacteria bacterium]|nr:DotU family type IV/VI secretion system protein [Acidobacteriota bacterium]